MTQMLSTQEDFVQRLSFSRLVPNLQLAWDSTSLGALKKCPRYYQYSILEGYTPRKRSIHLTFGLWLHESRERYYHARATGSSHEDALDVALDFALKTSWDSTLGRPHEGSEKKNRFTLVRTLVWYLDKWRDDPLETIILANGKPAVELTFSFDSGYASHQAERYMLCGHLDRLVNFQDAIYVSDLKSTEHTLDRSYFDGFTPDNQFTLYTLASKVVYERPARGLILDAAQVAVTFSRFARGVVSRTQEQLDEWYRDLNWWLAQAEMYATASYWPMNDKACFLCEFRQVCSKSQSSRSSWLQADYVRRVWDPLRARGDV